MHCKTDSLTKVMTLFRCQTIVSHTDSVVWKYIWGWHWYGSTNDTLLKKLLHGEAVVPPDSKIISSIIKQSGYLDEELFSKWNNKFYESDEFNNVLKMFKCQITFPKVFLSMSNGSIFTGLHLDAVNFYGTMLFCYTILCSKLDVPWGHIVEKNFTPPGILTFFMVLC